MKVLAKRFLINSTFPAGLYEVEVERLTMIDHQTQLINTWLRVDKDVFNAADIGDAVVLRVLPHTVTP